MSSGTGRAGGRPVRIAHLGAGNFFRAHQAWYTEHAPDAAEWGIAAYTGRGAQPCGGPYPLIVRAADGDRVETVAAVVVDPPSWPDAFTLPELAVVTATVTEAGWQTGGAPHRLVTGLAARRAAGLPGVAVVSCDNLPDNGGVAARAVAAIAAATDPGLARWIDDEVAFATTMVDRITPRATPEDGPGAVVTEPFAEWVLAGQFPAGRPAWDAAGARFVADVGPWEQRKLWLLNGSHSLMAYAGGLRGHQTVAEAIADPVVRGWVEQWWDVAAPHLPLSAAEVAAYRTALLERYANPRIRHLLAQIAADGSQKVPVRVWPVLHACVDAGHVPEGATRIVAAWICHLRGRGVPVTDVAAAEFTALAAGDLDSAVRRVLTRLDLPDERVHAAVTRLADELAA